MITIQSENTDLKVYPEGKRFPQFNQAIYSTLEVSNFSNPIARDLIRIGQAIFTGDRTVRRSMVLGKQTRDIHVETALENPKFFKGAMNYLVDLANFCTRDNWTFAFTEHKSSVTGRAKQSSINFEHFDCVALFSDGLDSLCGASRLLQSGAKPIFVSHFQPRWGHSTATRRISDIAAAFGRQEEDFPSISIRYELSDQGKDGRHNYFPENSRRSRPCLYLCYAAAAAIEFNISSILMHENGILSMNLPYTRSNFGALISRHANPVTLFKLQTFLAKIWPHRSSSPTVENPFFIITKDDQVAQFCKNLPAQLVESTSSCENASRSLLSYKGKLRKQNKNARTDFKQCGVCTPCLIRRQALSANGFDERNNYAFPWTGPSSNKKNIAKAFVNDNFQVLKNFCGTLQKQSETDFLNHYFAELSIQSECFGDLGSAISAIYKLHKKFAKQYLKTISSL